MSVVQVVWATVVVLRRYMSLENQVATLVSTTTALQNTVAGELTKVRAENSALRAVTVAKSGDSMSGPLALPSINTNSDSIVNGLTIGRGASNAPTNTVIGSLAGTIVGGASLTCFGHRSLGAANTGSWNTAIGNQCLSANTSGYSLTAVGHGALTANTTGINNSAVGSRALLNNIGGNSNSAMGAGALEDNTTGLSNTGVGTQALASNTTGLGNTALGVQASFGNLTANYNTAVGVNTLNANVSFDNCSGLGKGAQVSGSNQVQLGDASTTTFCYGPVQNRSDARDKTDIQPTSLGLEFIKALTPRDFRWDMRESYRTPMPEPLSEEASEEEKSAYNAAFRDWQEKNKFANLTHDGSKKKKRIHHGLIAQEVAEVIRTTNKDFGGFQDHKISGGDDVLSIGYDELIAPLIKAIQELDKANEELRTRIATLEARK